LETASASANAALACTASIGDEAVGAAEAVAQINVSNANRGGTNEGTFGLSVARFLPPSLARSVTGIPRPPWQRRAKDLHL